MQQRLALKHLSGSRANRMDRFSLPPEREIIFGRDPGCHVRYDEADDLVSRKHLKIVATDEKPPRYMVVDLGSRNGTFVNHQRVFGAVILSPGGHVQLGADGPEFEFQLDENEAQRHRPAVKGASTGKKRVTRLVILLLLFTAIAIAAGYRAWLWQDAKERNSRGRFDATAALASMVSIEAQWKVFDRQTGVQLARAYVPNERSSHSTRVSLVEEAPSMLPAFVLSDNGRIEPLLVAVGTEYAKPMAGGKWSARGVIISESGGVLTAAPKQRPWSEINRWIGEEPAGALLVIESQRIVRIVPLASTQFPVQMPAEAGFLAEQLPVGLQGQIRGRRLAKNDLRVEIALDVTASAQTWKATVASQVNGIWLLKSLTTLSGLQPAPLRRGSTRPRDDQPLWVVCSGVTTVESVRSTSDGPWELPVSQCQSGGAVFDEGGRLMALFIPDFGSNLREATAISTHRALPLLGDVTHGEPWHP